MLRHFLAFFIKNQVIYKHILIWGLALDKCRYRHQRVEPASCLVNTLTDEVCREHFLVKFFTVFKRIMLLCERHSSTVEPAVHNFRYPCHRLATYRACQMYIINIRSVQLDILGNILLCLFHQLSTASDTLQMSAFASPDRNRCAPVSVSGNCPVINVFEPVAESLLSYEIREPVNCIVVCHKLIF